MVSFNWTDEQLRQYREAIGMTDPQSQAQLDRLRTALEEALCPRNSPGYRGSVGVCVSAGNCGCAAREALQSSPPPVRENVTFPSLPDSVAVPRELNSAQLHNLSAAWCERYQTTADMYSAMLRAILKGE